VSASDMARMLMSAFARIPRFRQRLTCSHKDQICSTHGDPFWGILHLHRTALTRLPESSKVPDTGLMRLIPGCVLYTNSLESRANVENVSDRMSADFWRRECPGRISGAVPADARSVRVRLLLSGQ